MTRPKRYPYSKSQWEESTSKIYTWDGVTYAEFPQLRNRITGEVRNV